MDGRNTQDFRVQDTTLCRVALEEFRVFSGCVSLPGQQMNRSDGPFRPSPT